MLTKRVAAAILLSALMAGCTIETLGSDDGEQRDLPAVEIEQNEAPPPASDVADVIEGVLPSVVNIRVRSVQSTAFGDEESGGEGSGVVIDSDGVILTNNHVVECATDVEVAFNDGREDMDGRVIGTVPEKDLAIVSVDADDLKAIEVGRSPRCR